MHKNELSDTEMAAFLSYEGRVYADEEVVGYAPLAIVRTCLEIIISQNNFLIRLAQEANEKTGAKRKAALEELCDKLYPAHEVRGNCSRHALDNLKDELLRVMRPGMISRERIMVKQMRVVKDTTATLFDRLERIKKTTALKVAKQAIGHIYDLLIDPNWHGMTPAKFCADVGETFKAFYDACQENARCLQQEFDLKILRKDIREVKEISNANLYESSGRQQGKPLPDGRKMNEKRLAMIAEGVHLVEDKGYSISAAAEEVIDLHLHDRGEKGYGKDQVGTLRRAIGRELKQKGVRG